MHCHLLQKATALKNFPHVTAPLLWKGPVWVLTLPSPPGGGGEEHRHLVTGPPCGWGTAPLVQGGLFRGGGGGAAGLPTCTRREGGGWQGQTSLRIAVCPSTVSMADIVLYRRSCKSCDKAT